MRRWPQISPLTACLFGLALPLLLIASLGHHRLDADEGVVLYGAWRLLSGYRLYVDDFQFVTPGSNYLVYWLWRLFGPEFWVAKASGMISIYLTSVAIYLTSKELWPTHRPTLSMIVGPYLYCRLSTYWPTINHNTFNALILSWALLFAVRHLVNNRLRDLILSGLLSGVAILFLQHKGAIFVAAIAGCFLWFIRSNKEGNWLKRLLTYLVCCFLPVLTLLNWPVDTLYESLVEFPRNHYLTINKTSSLPLAIVAAFFVLILVSIREQINRAILLVSISQGMLLATSLQRPDLTHVLILTFPLLTLLCKPLAQLEYRFEEARIPRIARDLGSYLAMFGIMISGVVVWTIAKPNFQDGPGSWDQIQKAKAQCKSVYAGPFMPGLYYELRLQNPTSFGYLLTNFNTEQQFKKALEQLEKNRPKCILLSYENTHHFKYDINNPVEDFIRKNYLPQNNDGLKLFFLRE